jgi:hexosaminidase
MIALNSNAHFFELKAVEMSNCRPFPWSFLSRGALCVTLLFAFSTLAVAQVHLLPAPREAHFDGKTSLPARIDVTVPSHDADDEFAARDLLEVVKSSALKQPAAKAGAAAAYRVVLLRSDSVAAKALLTKQNLAFDPAMQSEGYVLVIEPH